MCLTECDGLFGERRTGAAVKTDSIQTASSVVVMSTSHLEKFAPIICTFFERRLCGINFITKSIDLRLYGIRNVHPTVHYCYSNRRHFMFKFVLFTDNCLKLDSHLSFFIVCLPDAILAAHAIYLPI